MKIAVVSDTHSLLDEGVIKHLQNTDEIWHAGDIGDLKVINRLEQLTGTLRIVSGNIDSHTLRTIAPENQQFEIGGIKVLLTHIAGSPTRYNKRVKNLISQFKPDILVCGHSHILKIMFDQKNNLLYINPGACGNHGFHHVRTMVVFEIINKKPVNMKVIELGKRGRL